MGGGREVIERRNGAHGPVLQVVQTSLVNGEQGNDVMIYRAMVTAFQVDCRMSRNEVSGGWLFRATGNG